MSNFRTDNATRRITSFPAASRLIELLLDDNARGGEDQGKPQLDGYVIGQLLGAGGGGEVYVGYREGSAVPLAVKFLKASLGKSCADSRAWRELDILTELKLDGIPAVQDYGIADGRFYIVTALVHGLTLDDECRERQLSLRARVELIARIADLVHSMHEHGVMHRDLKPGNIIIQDDGRPAIIDFGIALLVGEPVSNPVTADGAPIGSVGYMSPEQARGDKHALSIRTDIYGLGATACSVLTGKTLHDIEVPWHEAVRRTAQDPSRSPRDLDPTLPKSLAAVISRSVAFEPSHRYSSAALFAEDLRRWLNNEPIQWQPVSWVQQLRLSWHRNRRVFFVKAAMIALVAAVFVSSTLALAQYRIAVSERRNAAEAATLRDEAQKTAAAKSALADQEMAAKLQHEQRIGELEAREKRYQARITKHIELVKSAIADGALFQASVMLLGLGEEIQAQNMQDAELVGRFVSLVHQAIEQAKMKDKPKEQ